LAAQERGALVSTGALIVMALVLSVVWGGVTVTLVMAWRQEKRRNGL
jgi:hypothetical protein